MARDGRMPSEVALGDLAQRGRSARVSAVGARNASWRQFAVQRRRRAVARIVRRDVGDAFDDDAHLRCGASIVTTCVTLPYGSTCSSRSPGNVMRQDSTRCPRSARGVSFSDWML